MAKARTPLTFSEEEQSASASLLRAARAVSPEDQQMVQVGIRLPSATYRQFKFLALKQGVTVAALVARAMSEFLDRGTK